VIRLAQTPSLKADLSVRSSVIMQLAGAVPGCLPTAAAGVSPIQEQYRPLWDRPAFDGKEKVYGSIP
jgi:hypothetical protein